MHKGICFAGNLLVDQIKFVNQYPNPSALTSITETDLSLGGLVCNCAVDAAKLDPSIALTAIGIVGADSAGDYILEQLHKYPSINTSGIRKAGITSFTDVMTEPHGRRTFFHYRGANALLRPDDLPFDTLQADILHIGYILLLDTLDGPDPDYATALCRVLAHARAQGMRTSVDVVSEEGARFTKLVPPALQYTDYCFLNEIEAERTTGIPLRSGKTLLTKNFSPCLQALARMGVARWAIIHTPEISYGLDVASNSYWCEPSFKLPAKLNISSVGAGDAYATGMLLSAYYGWSMQRAMHTAAAVAAYSLRGKGASDSIQRLPRILTEMEAFQQEIIGG